MRAEACRSSGRLTAGVASPDDDDVVVGHQTLKRKCMMSPSCTT